MDACLSLERNISLEQIQPRFHEESRDITCPALASASSTSADARIKCVWLTRGNGSAFCWLVQFWLIWMARICDFVSARLVCVCSYNMQCAAGQPLSAS